MSNFTEAVLLAQAQIAAMQVQLVVAAAEKPLTAEEKRLNTIEQQLKEIMVRLNQMALTVERHKEQFEEWEKANKPDLGWLERQNARIARSSRAG
jgi:predicted GTPase